MMTTAWSGGMASALAAVTLALACARTPPPQPALPNPDSIAADSAARADSLAMAARLAQTRPRDAIRPMPVPRAVDFAIRAGTRTADGRPGANLWQQRVDYRIDAEIDPATARVQGVETIVYRNNSPAALPFLVFNLYQNAFSQGVQRVRRVPLTGGITLERVLVEGVAARAGEGPAPSYQIDGTLMALQLPRPVPPGGRIAIEIAWRFTVPPVGAPRTAHDRKEAFVVAQWYPQVAAYDDVKGWHTLPYWTNGEFYLEYGDFEVSLTAPEGWLVGATGMLENPDEVLTDAALARLNQAASQEEVVHVITADDHEANNVTLRQPGGQLTWRFRARNVRDFAFAMSNRYLWDAAAAVLPDAMGDGRPDTVMVHALYRPRATGWRDAARFVRHAINFNAQRWHPYPYPHITAAEGPIGGMEYPMLVFIGAPADPQALYEVLAHEVTHQWWPMLVGSNETEYAWQDEGLATYVENLAVKDRFPQSDPFDLSLRTYLSIAGSDQERPSMREADLYGIGNQYSIATYTKPGTLFRSLGVIVGERTLHAALRVYVDRWKFRHPTPWDFFNTVEDVTGRDLDWFWVPWFYETAVLDQAIATVDIRPWAGGERVMVLVEDQGGAPMPVPLVFTTATGETRRIDLPVEPWLEGKVRQLVTVDLSGRVQRIEIDPDRRLPDIDRADNAWQRDRTL
jgi:hypothetical protein